MMTNIRDQLIGTWLLDSYFQVRRDRQPDIEPMGNRPSGVLLYTLDGFMSAQLSHSIRPRFKGDLITGGSDVEYAEAARTFISYAGSFSVNEQKGTVIHHVQVSLFPNWAGEDQERLVTLSDQRLVLETVPKQSDLGDSVQRLTWCRSKQQ